MDFIDTFRIIVGNNIFLSGIINFYVFDISIWKAFEIYEEYNDKKFMGTSANGIGAYYLELEEYVDAIDYLNKSITFCKEVNLTATEGADRKQ